MNHPQEENPKSTLRTRAHRIADLSAHHVEGFVLRKGYTLEGLRHDYGYDLALFTYDYSGGEDRGEFESESVLLQLKAADSLTIRGDGEIISFAGIKRRHLTLWDKALMPVILIVYDATNEVAYWLDIQEYIQSGKAILRDNQQTLSVRIPNTNVLNEDAIEIFRQRKQARYNRPVS